jgi:thiamine-monophosphate kinase
MPLNEFSLIERFFSDIGFSSTQQFPHVVLGVGDDCALLDLAANHSLAVSSDSFVAGVHFPADAAPYDIARRCLAAAISDLAAMGAKPLGFSLALTLPGVDESWLQHFSDGLRESAEFYVIPLIGGDTTRGPLSITLHVHGSVPKSGALKRSGARPGDSIFVSGSLGDAAAALAVIEGNLSVPREDQHYFYSRFYAPNARVVLGQTLLDVATAAIDVSDGLLADLGHITRASAVAAELDLHKLPISESLQRVDDAHKVGQFALSGGDDYELCFTARPDQHVFLAEFSELLDVRITEVGRIVEGEGVNCLDAEGNAVLIASPGYRHF